MQRMRDQIAEMQKANEPDPEPLVVVSSLENTTQESEPEEEAGGDCPSGDGVTDNASVMQSRGNITEGAHLASCDVSATDALIHIGGGVHRASFLESVQTYPKPDQEHPKHEEEAGSLDEWILELDRVKSERPQNLAPSQQNAVEQVAAQLDQVIAFLESKAK